MENEIFTSCRQEVPSLSGGPIFIGAKARHGTWAEFMKRQGNYGNASTIHLRAKPCPSDFHLMAWHFWILLGYPAQRPAKYVLHADPMSCEPGTDCVSPLSGCRAGPDPPVGVFRHFWVVSVAPGEVGQAVGVLRP